MRLFFCLPFIAPPIKYFAVLPIILAHNRVVVAPCSAPKCFGNLCVTFNRGSSKIRAIVAPVANAGLL